MAGPGNCQTFIADVLFEICGGIIARHVYLTSNSDLFFFKRKKLTKLIGLVMNTRSNPNHGFYANRGLHEFSMRGLI